MANAKLGRPSKERKALLRGQVSDLLMKGRIETSLVRAKSVRSVAEKIITLAIKTFDDTVKTTKDIKDASGAKVKTEVVNDGAKRLNARRKMMSYLYDLQEQRKPKESVEAFKMRTEGINHPLIEKIFNVYGPRFRERAEKLGQGGGYTRIIKIGERRGDASERAIIEIIAD